MWKEHYSFNSHLLHFHHAFVIVAFFYSVHQPETNHPSLTCIRRWLTPRWCHTSSVAMEVVMVTIVSVALAETGAIVSRKLKGLILIVGSNYFPLWYREHCHWLCSFILLFVLLLCSDGLLLDAVSHLNNKCNRYSPWGSMCSNALTSQSEYCGGVIRIKAIKLILTHSGFKTDVFSLEKLWLTHYMKVSLWCNKDQEITDAHRALYYEPNDQHPADMAQEPQSMFSFNIRMIRKMIWLWLWHNCCCQMVLVFLKLLIYWFTMVMVRIEYQKYIMRTVYGFRGR